MLRYELDDEIDEPCLSQDLLRAAFGRINWSEIIENNIEQVSVPSTTIKGSIHKQVLLYLVGAV